MHLYLPETHVAMTYPRQNAGHKIPRVAHLCILNLWRYSSTLKQVEKTIISVVFDINLLYENSLYTCYFRIIRDWSEKTSLTSNICNSNELRTVGHSWTQVRMSAMFMFRTMWHLEKWHVLSTAKVVYLNMNVLHSVNATQLLQLAIPVSHSSCINDTKDFE